MKRKALSCDREQDTPETEQVPLNDWFTFEFGVHTLFVHPPSKRVCASPDGTVIGHFDPDVGEVQLFAEDAETEGAVELQTCEAVESHSAKHAEWSETFRSKGLVCFGGEGEVSMLREGLLNQVQSELEMMLCGGILSNLHDQPAEVRTDRVAYLRTNPDETSEEESERPHDLLEDKPCPPYCAEAFKLLEGLAAVLNRELNLGLLRPHRFMVACYETGGFYVAHRDNDIDPTTGSQKNHRAVTAILYANALDWCAEYGGALRCHVSGSQDSSVSSIDILPSGGRIVLFDSKRLLHEVLPTKQRRFALTVWFVTL